MNILPRRLGHHEDGCILEKNIKRHYLAAGAGAGAAGFAAGAGAGAAGLAAGAGAGAAGLAAGAGVGAAGFAAVGASADFFSTSRALAAAFAASISEREEREGS